jgi:hypothetical protein
MDFLELEALKIRNEVVRPLLLDKEVDGWTALAMVVAPSDKFRDASLRAAVKLINSRPTSYKIKLNPAVVSIDDLAAA